MLKRIRESKRVKTQLHRFLRLILVADYELLVPVVVRSTLSIHSLVAVLVISYIVAAALPLMRLVESILLDRVDKGLHAYCIATVILLQIVYVKLHSMPFAYVANREKVPLRVVQCVVIEVQKQIVLIFTDAFYFSEIA